MPCRRARFPYPVTVHTTADPVFEMNEAFDAAKSILERSDEESIRYSALELRRCIEAIVYGKLKIYQELLPGILSTSGNRLRPSLFWQLIHLQKTPLRSPLAHRLNSIRCRAVPSRR